MRRLCVSLAVTLFASTGAAAEFATWADYQRESRYKCPGPFDTLKTPQKLTLGGKTYSHNGYRLELDAKAKDADNKITIGVISAIKDVTEDTRANLADAFKWFHEAGAEWVVVNGDLALEEFDLEEAFGLLAEAKLPTLVTIGNSESRGSWARVFKAAAADNPNLVNGVLVRQIVADDVELWTLPGYHDKTFVRQGAGCFYDAPAIDEAVATLKSQGQGPVVLVAHGPPLGKGKNALDYIADQKNVGDPMQNRLLDKAKIPFGVFGHILEAGGRGVAADMATAVPPGKAVPSLFINAGSISADPWGMLDGKTGWGMAMLLVIDGNQARYEVKRFEQRE
jgi:hypothetical protein